MASDDPRIRVRGPCRQADRAIGWQHDTTVEVLRNTDSADGMPGLTDSLLWQDVRLFDAHEARGISGEPAPWWRSATVRWPGRPSTARFGSATSGVSRRRA